LHDRAAVEAAATRLGGQVLVARQVDAGPECFCGMTRDPHYGPVLAVGWGGTRVEATRPAVCAAPLERETAVELVREAGLPRAAEPLAGVLVALGRLAVEHPEVVEAEINPVILSAEGPVAVDALLVVEQGDRA
jgi:hypothetical protein